MTVRRVVLTLVMVWLTVALFLDCAPQAAAAPIPRPTMEFQIYGGAPGGIAHIMAIAVGEVLTKNIPWIKASAIESVGTAENIVRGAKADPQRTLIQAVDVSYWAGLQGKPPFDRKYTEVRFIAAWTMTAQLFITLDPKIKTLKDLAGKKVMITPAAHGGGPPSEQALIVNGVRDKVTLTRATFDGMIDPLVDGLVDVAQTSITIISPEKWDLQPAAKQIMARVGDKIYVIPWGFDTLKKIRELSGLPYGQALMPPRVMGPLQTQPIETWTLQNTGLAAFAGADADVIYEITKVLAENHKLFATYHKGFSGITLETMVSYIPVNSEQEVHPGALRYYKEKGLWPPKK